MPLGELARRLEGCKTADEAINVLRGRHGCDRCATRPGASCGVAMQGGRAEAVMVSVLLLCCFGRINRKRSGKRAAPSPIRAGARMKSS